MSTPHNNANPGQIAKVVIMPGDPYRAQFIAENYLDDYECVSNVRAIPVYTGHYKGHEISVMAHGMGGPSMGIYSYELFNFYDVDKIIRVGSCGAYQMELDLYDIILADSAVSESTFAKYVDGYESDTTYPSAELTKKISDTAEKMGLKLNKGPVHSCDVFYTHLNREDGKPFWYDMKEKRNCLAAEMESFALFHNAKVHGKEAASILTVSDSMVKEASITAEERQKGFDRMIRLALESVCC